MRRGKFGCATGSTISMCTCRCRRSWATGCGRPTTRDPYGVEEAKARITSCYGMIDKEVASRTWAMGETFGLADCAAAPALFYGNMAVPFGAEHKNVAAYFERAQGAALFRARAQGSRAVFRHGAEGDVSMGANKSDIIRALFAAYRANDRASVENSFTEDFPFTSPYDDRIDKATYFERCWRVSDWIERQQLEKIFVEGEEAFVTYEVVTKDGKRFRNTEFFRFDGDQISSIDVYFGASYKDGVFVKQQG